MPHLTSTINYCSPFSDTVNKQRLFVVYIVKYYPYLKQMDYVVCARSNDFRSTIPVVCVRLTRITQTCTQIGIKIVIEKKKQTKNPTPVCRVFLFFVRIAHSITYCIAWRIWRQKQFGRQCKIYFYLYNMQNPGSRWPRVLFSIANIKILATTVRRPPLNALQVFWAFSIRRSFVKL